MPKSDSQYDLHLIKVLGGRDGGGILTSELCFSRTLKTRTKKLTAIAIGKGMSSKVYQDAYHRDLLTPRTPFPKFDGRATKKITRIPLLIISSFFAAVFCAIRLRQTRQKKAVIVRKYELLLFSGFLALLLRAPLFWHVAELPRNKTLRFYRNFTCFTFNVILVPNSKYTAKNLGVDAGNVIYPGYSQARTLQYRPQTKKSKTLTYVISSRIVQSKAIDLAVNGFLQSRAHKFGCRLLIAGGPTDTEYAQKVSQLIEHSKTDHVYMLGHQDNIMEIYREADIVINSRRDAEPCGITILEALASGIPVIAYHEGGPSEFIRCNKNGWLLKEPSIAEYTRAIDKAWDNRHQIPSMALFCKESVRDLEATSQAEKLLRLINRRLHP
ncbi:hypothetical protein CKO15_11280 [Halorhodospira abdelmalekii]|uniref:glycosyltransferase family 4 protein n=1 Tax=Halorhodospira abdelmalekii TaxID=421629 RepID=UPI0019079EB3|nr:glycosyltransferase family 4 protein [Halorhodospira abdelmalekii]MBK1735848.1 hypothetical protein [Halorhodospira abdelmalekii]